MSLFGLMGGDFDDDLLGNHMNAMQMQMRSMNRLMNSFMPDPFNMMSPFDNGFPNNALMDRSAHNPMANMFRFPPMPNMNRLLSADIGSQPMQSYCSSSVVTMSSGPDGRPQIYQATSSTKTGPGGVRETRKTIQDSMRGVKKMAIGHHIGERSHIIEKEQDLNSGQLEERQEFINLVEDDAEDFDREFTTKVHGRQNARLAITQPMLTIEQIDDDDDDDDERASRRREPQALPAPESHHQNSSSTTLSSSSATALTSSTMPRSNAVNAANAAAQNNNNNYLKNAPRRSAYHHRLHHSAINATPRRPLRTPTSSPLTTSPTTHNHSTMFTPSIHPHPYNPASARRNHRPKHTKQHQETYDEYDDDEEQEHQPKSTSHNPHKSHHRVLKESSKHKSSNHKTGKPN